MGSGKGKTRRAQGVFSRPKQKDINAAEDAFRRYQDGELTAIEAMELVGSRPREDSKIGKLRKAERISWISKEEHKATKRVNLVVVLEGFDGEYEEYALKENVRTRWGTEFWSAYAAGRHEEGWWKPQVKMANAFSFDQDPSTRE